MSRESYIVRIYNRPELTGLVEEAESITGIVEEVESGTKHTFRNMEELWNFIAENKTETTNRLETTN